ncbi:uncharacterized protein LOC124721764 [Schistocerca piceifrons]|uniref:uncharacterized protein LOC124721764 n=1 Tax=Schistocerca piceifrons TaxID=274613 RepID=UPI001F5FA189|nr:uncharacterized protein LOC124721764 [Schistocerca piceifrons]
MLSHKKIWSKVILHYPHCLMACTQMIPQCSWLRTIQQLPRSHLSPIDWDDNSNLKELRKFSSCKSTIDQKEMFIDGCRKLTLTQFPLVTGDIKVLIFNRVD